MVETNFAEPSPDTVVDNILTYEVFTNKTGIWEHEGWADAATPYSPGGEMTYHGSIEGYSSAGFKIAPVYKYVNFENDGSNYTSKAWSDTIWVKKVLPKVTVHMSNGYNLFGVTRDEEDKGTKASFLAQTLEKNNSVRVTDITYYKNGEWRTYLHRDGSSGQLLKFFDFDLSNELSYFIGISEPADQFQFQIELDEPSSPEPISVNVGWNAISLRGYSQSTADAFLNKYSKIDWIYKYDPMTGWIGQDQTGSGDDFDLNSGDGFFVWAKESFTIQ